MRLARAFVCLSEGERPCGRCADCRKAEKGVHPDIVNVSRDPDRKELTVDKIRALCADAAVMPNEAAKKVYVIHEADAMNTQAQNAFLKTLEEPPSFAAFLLEAENPELLLPTVRSRCALLAAPAEETEREISERAGAFLDTLASGPDSELMRLLFSLEKLDKNELSAFFTEVKSAAAASLRGDDRRGLPPARLTQLIRLLDEAEKYAGFNVSGVHIIGLLTAGLLGEQRPLQK